MLGESYKLISSSGNYVEVLDSNKEKQILDKSYFKEFKEINRGKKKKK